MKANLVGITLAAIAYAAITGVVAAQTVQGVTVQATRILSTNTVGRTANGIPIVDLSLSYGVSTAGLDLASHAGAMELEKRVHDAGIAACKEISRQYADAMPNEAECAKAATDKALVRVHELEAAADKQAAR